MQVDTDADIYGSRPKLTPRQEQCLRAVLELKSAKEIARDLGITQHGVEKHLKIARAKFGVSSTAAAARIFASLQQGTNAPHYGASDLEQDAGLVQQRLLEAPPATGGVWFENTPGALVNDTPLSPRQTLLTIAALSFGSIVGLLLLVACAEAVRRLVSN